MAIAPTWNTQIRNTAMPTAKPTTTPQPQPSSPGELGPWEPTPSVTPPGPSSRPWLDQKPLTQPRLLGSNPTIPVNTADPSQPVTPDYPWTGPSTGINQNWGATVPATPQVQVPKPSGLDTPTSRPSQIDTWKAEQAISSPMGTPVTPTAQEKPTAQWGTIEQPQTSVTPTAPAQPTTPESELVGDPARTEPDMELRDRGYLTPGGELVAGDLLAQYQRGEYADVQNRRQQLDREADQFEYMVMKQARDAAAQAGLQPGTAAYNELMQNAMAQANQNRLGTEQQVNEMTRQYRTQGVQDLMNMEQAQRELAIGERGFEFTRADIDYLREESKDLKSKEDALRIINNVEAPGAKQALSIALEKGLPAFQAEVNKMFDEYGAIAEGSGYRPTTPIENERQYWEERLQPGTRNPITGDIITAENQQQAINDVVGAVALTEAGVFGEGAKQMEEGFYGQEQFDAVINGDAPFETIWEDWGNYNKEQRNELRTKQPDMFATPSGHETWKADVGIQDQKTTKNRDAYLDANPWLEGKEGKYIEWKGDLVKIIEAVNHQEHGRDWFGEKAEHDLGTIIQYPDGTTDRINITKRYKVKD